ncbi:hypothetical protein DmGdi_31450 [Gluconobacter sp. Gdi]|nr:hypothetical protein DmGdi_31450 [Gluconobacter sp. Gdi]
MFALHKTSCSIFPNQTKELSHELSVRYMAETNIVRSLESSDLFIFVKTAP